MVSQSLGNQLPDSVPQARLGLSTSDSRRLAHVRSSSSVDSLLSPFITVSHSWLQTRLFHESFPGPSFDCRLPSGLPSLTKTQTGSSMIDDFLLSSFSSLFFCYGSVRLITFCVSRRRRKMYCGHARLCVCVCVCVCLSVRGHMPTLLHGPGCNLGAW